MTDSLSAFLTVAATPPPPPPQLPPAPGRLVVVVGDGEPLTGQHRWRWGGRGGSRPRRRRASPSWCRRRRLRLHQRGLSPPPAVPAGCAAAGKGSCRNPRRPSPPPSGLCVSAWAAAGRRRAIIAGAGTGTGDWRRRRPTRASLGGPVTAWRCCSAGLSGLDTR